MSYYTDYYDQTCPTYMGNGAVKQLGISAEEKGLKKLLIVTDPFIVQSYIMDRVKSSLDDHDIAYVIYSDINSDPLDTKVYEATELAKKEKVDGIVGVGGGSSLDGAKSICILTTNPGPLSKYYGNTDYDPCIPLFMVPTTTGTGSENTVFSVISDTQTGTKKVPYKAADLAICDPELTRDLPPDLTASTGMDAFAHAAETMTGLIQCQKTDALCGFGIQLLIKYMPIAVEDGTNIEARENLMIASNLIGIGFGVMGCHIGHAIGQCIGAKYHTAHGISCAWPLPATMEYAAVSEPEKVKLVADYMGLDYPEDISNEGIGKLVSDAISAFMKRIHVKPMSAYGITREGLIDIADIVMADNCWPVIPRELTKPELEELLGKVYDSYQG